MRRCACRHSTTRRRMRWVLRISVTRASASGGSPLTSGPDRPDDQFSREIDTRRKGEEVGGGISHCPAS